ncbi:aldo/keto reductase [Microbacterium sp. gxy059]|uniref:aldo/keto reductase n=1 Tax=Microbacterium sp. gxy059 TaxID=2957199 RepID=UPI003D99AC65
MTRIGTSDLDVFPLNLGGNVFGWTADRDASFRILDAFVDGGGDFIDTADVYSAWAPGNSGGESERIIGDWLSTRAPEGVVVATKVGQHPDHAGLAPDTVRAAVEASLERLGTTTIDLLYAHRDDPDTPLDETVAAFGALVDDGIVRHTALSNYSAERIREWIDTARRLGVPEPVALQPHYNLVERDAEADVLPEARAHGLGILPYYALASGFLTGKYRAGSVDDSSPRAGGAAKYATSQGLATVDALERVARARGASIATIALAWLRAQPGVVAPIASASRPEQIPDLLAAGRLDLAPEEIAEIDRVSQPE